MMLDLDKVALFKAIREREIQKQRQQINTLLPFKN
jgi:hypothetical protein